MSQRVCLILILALVSAGCPGRPRDDDEPRTVRDSRLEGTWKIVSAEKEGRPLQDPLGARLTFSEESVVVQQGDEQKIGTFQVHPESQPRTIDLRVPEGKKMEEERGIYAWDGKRLKLCMAAGDATRPADFTTKPGQKNVVLMVLERIDP